MSDTHAFEQTAVLPGEAGFGDYVQLLKPRVMSLVVFTALVGLLVAPVPVQPDGRLRLDPVHRARRGGLGRAEHVVGRRYRRRDAPHAQAPGPRGDVSARARRLAWGWRCRALRW